MLQSISINKLGRNVKNPFSILFDQDFKAELKPKKVEKEFSKDNFTRKIPTIPFSKYQIKHQAKSHKQISIQKIENAQDNNNQPQFQQKQLKTIISQTTSLKKISLQKSSNEQQKSQKEQIAFARALRPNLQTKNAEEQQERQLLCTKKHRQIKIELNADGDPPLLYDIGLDAEMIKDKMKSVIKLDKLDYDMVLNPDLTGPVVIAFFFGFLLLFSGKIYFGDIYAIFIIGSTFLFILFNFMAKKGVVSLFTIMSILGYCLLPMLILGLAGIFFKLKSSLGLILGLAISVWSSVAGGNFISVLVGEQKGRKMLIIYPLFLFYGCFAMIVIF